MTASVVVLSPAAVDRVTRRTSTFPFVALPSRPGGVPVEVSLVARLGHGTGTRLFYDVLARQREHGRYVDELDEPSAKLGGTDFSKGDATALYSFGVGPQGHPFHRHAGHRVFTAISGSGGAQLRFSSVTPDELESDPARFVRALRHVDVPPDCLFTVRFSGETWHQFAPLQSGSRHPAFFALSTHTNELGGALSDALRQQVLADRSNIPSLTELLPQAVLDLLKASPVHKNEVPTTALSLDETPGGLLETACKHYRSAVGLLQGSWQRVRTRSGFVSELRPGRVREHHDLPVHSLLLGELNERTVHHQDAVTLTVPGIALPDSESASGLLADLLDGFLDNRSVGVSRLMALRNVMVRPLKLRTSPLGCPVSSLLSPPVHGVFAGRFPVRSARVADDECIAQVILGADDKHLVFRSCVSVRRLSSGDVEFSLATRVACTNLFGRLYMALISTTHRKYIAPTMLEHAVQALLNKHRGDAPDARVPTAASPRT